MVPRILLLTGVAPGRVDVGRIFLRDLCLAYPHDRICCFHVEPLPESARSPELDWLPTTFACAPPEHGFRRLGYRIARLTRSTYERYIEVTKIPSLVKEAVQFGKTHKVDMVWVALHSPTTVRIARPVADALRVPLVTTVWDPPTYRMMSQYQPDRWTFNRLLGTFANTVRSAVRCGVASEAMKHQFEQDWGTPCVVMVYGLRRPAATLPSRHSSRDDRLVIGFAGGFYADEEWNALLSALAAQDWRVAGRSVVVKILGSCFRQDSSIPLQIEYLGWRDSAETVHLLSQMDVGYLPYPFDARYRDMVQLSFPGKLATYVAARIPVLYHGPRESSPATFLERFPVGIGCHSLSHSDIIETLELLVMDAEFRRRARNACDQAFEQELNASVFRRRFAELIGVSEADLLPQVLGPAVSAIG